jgi:2-polyprenyl-3-methyl-5-hydroxy-6-metoxy-1,4-benzoquinol methylase
VSESSGYYDVLRNEIEPLLPPSYSRVMDIGCGAGVTSKWLKQRRANVESVGVEIDVEAARQAGKVLDRVIVADIERDRDFINDFSGKIDLLLLLDILEHLQDPWSFLQRVKQVVNYKGCIIASLPNIRNMKVILPLVLDGQWRYSKSGLLDVTHLRFFTRRTILELFASAGLVVDRISPTGPVERNNVKSAAGAVAFVLNKATRGAITEFIAHQFLVRARKRP